MKVICIGDSITRGFGVRNQDSWLYKANQELDATIINHGIPGDTTGGMLARFHGTVLKESPRVVMIMGGGNDFRAGCPPYIAQSNVMSMVYTAHANGILPIVGLTVPTDWDNIAERWRRLPQVGNPRESAMQYRQWLQEFSEATGTSTIDFYEVFAQKELSTFYLDGLHPNEKGQQLMAEYFVKRYKEITSEL